MVTRIDLTENVKRRIRPNEKFIWCGSTAAGAKIWEMEEAGDMLLVYMGVAVLIGFLSLFIVFAPNSSAGDRVTSFVLAACCFGGVFAALKLKTAGANYALTDKRAMIVTDSGGVLKEYDFSDRNLMVDYHVSKRNVGYVVVYTLGVRGHKYVHFKFKGISDPEELYDLVTTVCEYKRHGGVKIVQTGKPADKEAPVTAAQPINEKPVALSGYKRLSDVTGIKRHISDAEDDIKPLNIQYEAEEHIYEHLEPGEKLLWCEKQDRKSGRNDKGGCLLGAVIMAVVFELVIQLFGRQGNYPEEVFSLIRMFFIPVYIFMGILVLAMLIKKYDDIWAVTDRRLLRISKKKHVVYTMLSNVPMNGIQLTDRPDSDKGDLRIRAGWMDKRTNKPLVTIEVWQGVTNAREVADLIDRASLRYLKRQGFEEVGIESEQVIQDNKNNFI